MEKMGIYCIVFSMLEDRLETLWWNCSYVHEWKVIGEWDDENLPLTKSGQREVDFVKKHRASGGMDGAIANLY